MEDWDLMERFWEQCIFRYLRAEPEDHFFLLVSFHSCFLMNVQREKDNFLLPSSFAGSSPNNPNKRGFAALLVRQNDGTVPVTLNFFCL